MSAIAGAVSHSASQDSPVYPATERLLGAMRHRNTGPPSTWHDAFCSLGIHHVQDTSESRGGRQPLRDEKTGCVLVWDGRLDNREELLRTLPDVDPQAMDAEIVLGGYREWEENCAARFRGDFAFAVWDPRSRSFYAARDRLGIRPFFYHAGGQRFFFASEFQALLQLPEVPRDFDEVTISEFLLWWADYPDMERTFFQAIRRLRPAHWLRFTARGLEIHRYWKIDPHRHIRYQRHEDYVEQFSELLSRAVASRVRSHRRLAVFLSGGMDSSAVAILAGRHAPSSDKLRAYCAQLPDSNDESGLAEMVAQQAGIPFQRYPLREASHVDFLETHIRQQGMPFADLAAHNDQAMLNMAADDGCEAILTGDGSDELFNFPLAYLADLMHGFHLLKLIRELGPYSRYNSRGPLEMLMMSYRYVLPRSIVRLWKFLKWRKAPDWVHPDLAHRTGLVHRLRWVPQRQFDSMSAEIDHYALTRGRVLLGFERLGSQAARSGLHYRYPFLDCSLMEFMFAVPWEEKVTGGRVKSFLREAPGLLPEPVRGIRRKANYNPFADRRMSAQKWDSLRDMFQSPPPRAGEYVDLCVARRVCDSFLSNPDVRQQQTFLVLAGFFLWLKNYA